MKFKKCFTLLCCLAMATCAMAQVERGDVSVAFDLGYGSLNSNVGIGARIQYGLIDHLRVEAGTDYFFKNKHTTVWDINANVHYLFNIVNERHNVYPIVGLNLTSAFYDELAEKRYEYGKSDTNFGVNLGAGYEYTLTDHIRVGLEYRHSIEKNTDQGFIAAHIGYKF